MDMNCTRTLLLLLADRLSPTPTGKRAKPVKLRYAIAEPPLDQFPPEEVFACAQYIVGKNLVIINALEPKYIPVIAPRKYVFLAYTPKGTDYLAAIRDETLWKKLLSHFGNVFEATIPELISAAAQFGFQLFLG